MTQAANSPLSVVHVDADRQYAQLVETSLRRAGREIEVRWAPTPEAALDWLASARCDALLVEPWSPGDAFEVGRIERLLAAAPSNAPAIALSQREDEPETEGFLALGGQDHLAKGRADGVAIMRAIRFAAQRLRHSATQPLPIAGGQSDEPPLPILLIEDNPGDACLIEEGLLEAWSGARQVTTVGRLAEALRLLGEQSFHAAVVDLALPDSRGLDTCRALRQSSPGLPFIVHSGSDNERLALQTVQQGASDFLAKTNSRRGDLARAIRHAASRQRAVARLALCAPALASSASAGSASFTPFVAERAPQVEVSTSRGIEHRQYERYPVIKPAVAIPVGPRGMPEWAARMVGFTRDISRGGLALELDADRLAAKTLVVGVERRDGVLCYAGVEVRNRGESGAGGIVVGGRFGGRGQEVLEAANLAATFDPTTWRLHRAIPDDVIEAWRAIDVLAPKLLDAVLVCPRCQGLPTFRAGCKSCGSGRIGGERLIHHFACAHVGPIGDFERPEGVVCPKCRMRNLVVGADYDFQNGPVRCSDCHWRGDAPGQIAQCLACRYRFPGEDARQIEITGYHVHRLDPLAFIAAP